MIRRSVALLGMLRAERLPDATLAARRDARLRELICRAARDVPFYRDLLARHGIDPTEIRSAGDLVRLPVIDKAALRQAGEAAWSTPHERDIWISTSGSTGEPYRFPIDRRYDQLRKAQYLRPYLSNGRGIGQALLRLTARPRARRPLSMRLGLLRELQVDSGAPPRTVVDLWRSSGCTLLQGYPSALRILAQHCATGGGRLDPVPRRIFTDSELLGRGTRQLIERHLGAAITDIFGTFETDNIAYQCEAGGGYHVTTDAVVLEVVRDGRVMPCEEEGELVVTVLDNHRSPFIRYNLHDHARWARAPCTCGRRFPLLEVLQGRADHLIRLPDHSERSAMDVLGRLDGLADQLLQYQLRQHGPRSFTLLYVPTPAFAPANADTLRATIAPLLGAVDLQLRHVPRIPLTPAGKWLAFVRDFDL
jgi:phenylacetate-CoA ligase